MSKLQIAIECLPEVSDQIEVGLNGISEDEVIRAEQDNLDGSLPTVLLVAQTAAPFFAAILPILAPYLLQSKVTRLKIKKSDGSEVEIENPTQEQVEKYFGE